MLCEVCYFFCGGTDSYFEENAKDGTISGRTEALLEELSETFRANPDSILMKLDELGLSLEDLGDEDNLASLATTMNEGAANMGLPTIEDLDSAVSTLHEKLSANWSSYFEVEEA